MNINKKMVLVEWHDARFFSGTYKEETIKNHKMALFNSLGYLIAKDKITTVLAAELNNENEYRDITLIPTGSIISIKKLTPVPFM
ncbi:hypothetical protein JXA85_04925 [Candidatus Woesearchaeota archaeon]|nr:hypothetical protein [Candidatus Woesearchaeota archaeon]